MPAHHLIGLVPHTNGTRAPNPEDSELANATALSPGPDVHETNLSHGSEPMQDEFLSIDKFIKPYLRSLEERIITVMWSDTFAAEHTTVHPVVTVTPADLPKYRDAKQDSYFSAPSRDFPCPRC
ncbi:hypothetical protein K438DRAFT_1791545 [Mycena galopus ATCC 62051]|nr:hypothetical protein K438DRAFT_1791545 [Mycena galopus ATCC 62051]